MQATTTNDKPAVPILPHKTKKDTARAFERVFGQPGRRSPDQELVAEALQFQCCIDENLFTPDAHGQYDVLRAAHRDGAASVWRAVCEYLRLADAPESDLPTQADTGRGPPVVRRKPFRSQATTT